MENEKANNEFFGEDGIYLYVISIKPEFENEDKGKVTLEVKDESGSVYTVVRSCYKYKNCSLIKYWHCIYRGLNIVFRKEIGKSYYYVVCITRAYETKGKKVLNSANISKKDKACQIELGKEAKEITPSKKELNQTQSIEVVDGGEIKHEKYNTIKACLESNIPVYLAGPAGSGKNFTVEQIAKELGWNFYFSNSVQQEYKLTGFIDAGGKYHDTEFYKACSDEKDCVFFLDEMDASIPEVLVLLNAAIANGYFEFPNGRKDLNHVHFVAAGNTVGSGADESYTGRMVIDQATLDRFAIIEFDYDKNVEMSLAKGDKDLVDFIRGLRRSAIDQGIRATFSYRAIIMVVKLNQTGLAIDEIIKIAVLKGLDKDTARTLYHGSEIKGKLDKYSAGYRKAIAA